MRAPGYRLDRALRPLREPDPGDRGSGEGVRDRPSRSPASTCGSRPARSSGCSAPTARARPRSCRSSPGCAGPTPAASRSAGSTWCAHRRRRAGSSGSRRRTPACTSRYAYATTCGSSPGSAGLLARDRSPHGSTRSPARSGSRRCSTGAPHNSRAANGDGCTPRSRCCTDPRSCCSTSRRPAPTCGPARRSSSSFAGSPTKAPRSCTRRTTCTRSSRCAPRSRSSTAGGSSRRAAPPSWFAATDRARSSSRSSTSVPPAARVDGAVVDGATVRIPDRRSGRARARTAAGARRRREIAAVDRDRATEPRIGVPHRHRAALRQPTAIGGRRVISSRRRRA